MKLPRPTLALATMAALSILPTLAGAQRRDDRREERPARSLRISLERYDRRPDREISMSVGALRSDDDDLQLPMAALRTDWRVRRWLRSELGVSYAIGNTEAQAGGLVSAAARSLQLGTATVGLRAEWPMQVVRPYVGIATGVAFRREEGAADYVRTTTAFPAGLRLVLGDRVSLRGEARFRFDQRRTGGQNVLVEQTGGLSVAF
ncbi:MAG: hypothetical protein IT355_18695 [Gemmatimonadaceae bacterium]|nr:hypothetical protein [Gemmatimonadaceae bacterium]